MADLKLTATYKEYGDEIWFGGDGCGMWIIESDPHNDLTAYLGGLGQTKKGRELMEARARLLAAAPELYDACVLDPAGVPVPELLRQVADYLNGLGGGPMEDRLRIAADNIKAALAKAKGKA